MDVRAASVDSNRNCAGNKINQVEAETGEQTIVFLQRKFYKKKRLTF